MPEKSSHLDQAKDTGLSLCLILSLIAYYRGNQPWLALAMAILLASMLKPMIFRPLSKVWFGFSHHLGKFMSKMILSLIFISVVTPVGLIRHLSGRDPMRRKQWRTNPHTAFIDRHHRYSSSDMEKPF